MSFDEEIENLTLAEWLLTTEPEINGAFTGWANPTGVALVVILIIVGIGVHPKMRQKGHFELFYWTHILYIPFSILLVLHCDSTFWWLLIPLTIFLYSKIWLIKLWFDGRGKTYVVSGVILPSNVTQLNIRRMERFNYHPGDWVFINVPIISMFEWHPFTIS
jgi:predicted ferric reductase